MESNEEPESELRTLRKISRGGSVLLHLLEKQGRYVIFDVKVPGGYNTQWAKKRKIVKKNNVCVSEWSLEHHFLK